MVSSVTTNIILLLLFTFTLYPESNSTLSQHPWVTWSSLVNVLSDSLFQDLHFFGIIWKDYFMVGGILNFSDLKSEKVCSYMLHVIVKCWVFS